MTDGKELADRPATKSEEIKVTPEMVDAGMAVFSSVWLEFTSDAGSEMLSLLLEGAYRAMSAAFS